MGACVSRVRSASERSDAEPARPSCATDLPAKAATPALAEAAASDEACSREPSARPLPNGAPPASPQQPPEPTARSAPPSPASRRLAERAAFWGAGGTAVARLGELSLPELQQEYHRDSGVLLEALDYLEQLALRSQRPSPAGSPSPAAAPQEEPHHLVSLASGGEVAFSRRLLQSDPLLAGARQCYEDGKVLGARAQLRRFCEQHGLQPGDLVGHAAVLGGLDAGELLDHCERVDEMLRRLSDESDFSVARDSGGLRVLYKCEKARVHHIKMEATLPHALERPLSLAREFDLMAGWNKYVTDSRLLAAPSIWESWVYGALWMPFPFPQVEALATGRGYDMSDEDRSLLISIRSCEEAELPPGCPPLSGTGRRKRAAVVPGSAIRFEALPPSPDGAPRTKGTILAIVDPHIPHVPAFIVNFVLGVLAPFAHKQIAALLKHEFDDPRKPFPRRLAASPQLYARVRARVAEGLARHYGVQAAQEEDSPGVVQTKPGWSG